MLLGGATSALALKTVADEAAGANPLFWQVTSSISAGAYGLSAGRPGLGAAMYCALSTVNEMIDHGDPTWWAISTAIFTGLYAFFDGKKTEEVVAKVRHRYYHDKPGPSKPREAPSPAGPVEYLPPDADGAASRIRVRKREIEEPIEIVASNRKPKKYRQTDELVLLEAHEH
jgi:hypothetical protein